MTDKSTAEQGADDAKARQDAVTPGKPAERTPGEQKAEDAELKRQADVRDAVAKAHDTELPKLGGPLKDPGLGQ